MTLTELKYIVAVARERHFGKAADACFVSQPTLSVAVKKLEEELEVKLFERNASTTRLTVLGRALYADASALVAASEQLARTARDVLAGNSGTGSSNWPSSRGSGECHWISKNSL